MKPSARALTVAMGAAMVCLGLIGTGSVMLYAQSPTPGAVGAMGPGGGKGLYTAVGVVVSKTAQAARHLSGVAHRGQPKLPNPLAGLQAGQTVVVQYSVRDHAQLAQAIGAIGGPSPGTTEGVITHVDPRQARLTVRFANGYLATFQLLDRRAIGLPRNAQEAAQSGSGIVIDHVNDSGRRLVHVFKEVPPKHR